MEATPIRFGKYSIPSPCPVPEDELLRMAHENQYCNRCQQSVYDISGMQPREIEALRRQNGGRLCVAFYESNPPLMRNRYSLMPLWLRGAAATATFTALLLQAPAVHASTAHFEFVAPSSTPIGPDTVHNSPPLLLSSVILDADGRNIPDDVVIKLEFSNGEKREIVTHAGFFAVNLEGMVDCDAKIKLHIAAQKFEDGRGSRSYPAHTASILAESAQNLELKLNVVYVYRPKMRGAIERR